MFNPLVYGSFCLFLGTLYTTASASSFVFLLKERPSWSRAWAQKVTRNAVVGLLGLYALSTAKELL